MNLSTTIPVTYCTVSSRLPAAGAALLLGLVIIFGVGFAQGDGGVIHNAAHDTRHAMIFPCH